MEPKEIVRRFVERGESLPVVGVTLGYELRCAAPIPFDIDYTRTLGYGAVRFLLGLADSDGIHSGGVVCIDNGRLRVQPSHCADEQCRADNEDSGCAQRGVPHADPQKKKWLGVNALSCCDRPDIQRLRDRCDGTGSEGRPPATPRDRRHGYSERRPGKAQGPRRCPPPHAAGLFPGPFQIGRASCRERV